MPRAHPTLHGQTLGFRVWSVSAHGAMSAAHTHPDIEFNYLRRGRTAYLLGGTRHGLDAGRLAVFWGGVPHQTLEPGVRGDGIWLTLPLAWFLQWPLPAGLANRLLSGELIQAEIAPAQIEQWLRDYGSGDALRAQALLLELQAWLTRLAPPVRRKRTRPPARGAGHVERISACIAAHYQESITIADLARLVKLHPKYLMHVFKRHCRIGAWEYLTRLRVSHAQRLLVTTDARVADLALESGFGSTAAFYQAFAAYSHGVTPLDYRRRHLTAPEPGARTA